MVGVILLERFPILLGSGEDCDIVIQAPGMAPSHLRIEGTERLLTLTDISGTGEFAMHGTKVATATANKRNATQFSTGQFAFCLCHRTVAEAKQLQSMALATTAPATPATDEGQWFFSHGGIRVGPTDADVLKRAAKEGRLAPTDTIWRERNPTRIPASEVTELNLFGTATPPTPVPAPPSTPDSERTIQSVASQPASNQGRSLQNAPAAAPAPSTNDHLDMDGMGGSIWAPNPEGGEITCPHCWYEFGLKDMLAVARSEGMRGDSVLGAQEFRRFLPTMFAANGNPLDPGGVECRDWACPRCHLELPPSMRGCQTFFLSIVGGAGSGKSYFLAAMSWRLKEVMPARFNSEFLDLDNRANAWLSEYEDMLFMAVDEEEPQKIDKTTLRGDTYRGVLFNGQVFQLPRPCLFKVQPFASDPLVSSEEESRLIVCYDNAGEHFQPEHDSVNEPGTEHIARAGGMIYMVDPILDVGLRRAVVKRGGRVERSVKTYPQHTLLNETFNRVRKLRGVGSTGLYEKPLVVCLSKADVFGDEFALDEPPWVWSEDVGGYALDMGRLAAVSFHVRSLIHAHAPQIVRTIEAFARHAIYVPVSGLGHCPGEHRLQDSDEVVVESFAENVRPIDIRPGWVEAPLLYILSCLGDIPVVREPASDTADELEKFSYNGRVLRVTVPEQRDPLEIPACYGGYCVQVPSSGRWVRVPQVKGVESL